MDRTAELVVKETHLSRKPKRESPWIALASILLLLIVSLTYWFDFFGVAHLLPAVPEKVNEGELWRLVTSIGTHADFRHFLGNGIAFGILSFLLYGYFGGLVYPLLTWTLGTLVTLIALATYPPTTRLIGASGVVYLMAGFWLTMYLGIERRLTPARRLFRAVGFALIVLVPTVWDPSVSYRTHGIGFAVGAVFGVIYFVKRKDALRRAERAEWD
jgi:membrane associated rhomboid family serine protease